MDFWRGYLTQRSKGDDLGWFWRLFFLSQRARPGLRRHSFWTMPPKVLMMSGMGSFFSSPLVYGLQVPQGE